MKLSVLHLDDNLTILDKIKNILESKKNTTEISFQVTSCENTDEFRSKFKQRRWDIVLLDIELGQENEKGSDLIPYILKKESQTTVIMCSSHSELNTIAGALRAGARDFVEKSATDHEFLLRVANIWQQHKAQNETVLRQTAGGDNPFIGKTIVDIGSRIPKIVDSAITAIHIFGESGTGKEVVAELFERQLADNIPFVKINCGAMSPSLLESELFGYVKGAFTGAQNDRVGLIEKANRGWIFMDEVATLSEHGQISLLRVLENKTLRRVGSVKEIKVDIKIISATNESLPNLIKQGKFRDDLWQRLCEARLDLPPLRDRKNEIPDLIAFFAKNMEGGPYHIDAAVTEIMSAFPWSYGNIRELRNCLRAMTEKRVGRTLTPMSIPQRIWDAIDKIQQIKPSGSNQSSDQNSEQQQGTLKINWFDETVPSYNTLSELLLLELIRYHANTVGKLSVSSLARLTSVSRSTLTARIKAIIDGGHIDRSELSSLINLS